MKISKIALLGAFTIIGYANNIHPAFFQPIGKKILQLPIRSADAIFQHVQIQKAESINKEDYPYFYRFIKEVDKQYPTLELSKCDFKLGDQWLAYHSTITSLASDIVPINEIMKKKSNGEGITEAEQRKLDCVTWILLHEGSHIKHHDYALRFGIAIGIDIAKYKVIEAIYKKRYPCKRGAFLLSFLATLPMYHSMLYYFRNQEKLADQFSLDHATKETLESGKIFLTIHDNAQTASIEAQPIDDNAKKVLLYFLNNLSTHPSFQSRIDRIDNAMEKRFPNNTQSDCTTPGA